MKSVKPGRGPSMMGGVMSIIAGLFGVFWTIKAAEIGGGFFALFGILFIAAAAAMAVYHFKNATKKNRYSAFDIVDRNEEPDPLNERFGSAMPSSPKPPQGKESRYCLYCGSEACQDFSFCNKCGKKLP